MKEYKDALGRRIAAGMKVTIGDDPAEEVFACVMQDGEENLGVNAGNEAYLAAHPEAERKYYPLSNFPAGIIFIAEG